jgi:hypothetical protein
MLKNWWNVRLRVRQLFPYFMVTKNQSHDILCVGLDQL